MRVADLMKRKRQRVEIRVPARLYDTLGRTAQGVVLGLQPSTETVTLVRVKVKGNGEHLFRPQDLSCVG